ncbi:O-antigen polysaccharide polymerase Wzy family protein [Knoellia sp. LjRoot47]|uniref:O-antigen polysaccharide polymerase Wzy family protein n=1 Tax=Knoellia sp. LjRoot47 TaxID=3342330 RepID=UPI003ECC263E
MQVGAGPVGTTLSTVWGVAASLVLLGAGIWTESAVLTTYATLLLATVVGFVAWLDRRRAFPLLAFVVCFVLFLISRQAINATFGTPPNAGGVLGTDIASEEALVQTNTALFLGLSGLLLGWFVTGAPAPSSTPSDSPTMPAIRKAAAFLFVLTIPLQLYTMWSAARIISSLGFFEGRLTAAAAPGYLRVAEALFHISFFAYLAARPSKRGALVSCGAYVLVGAFSLITLVRSEFILSVGLVTMYLYHRQLTYDERWFTRWRVVGMLALMPFALAVMNAVGSQRGRLTASASGYLAPVLDFLRSQGVSVRVVASGYEYSSVVPEGRWYSFGPMIESAQKAIALATGSQAPRLQGQSAERAIEGHQYAHTISYLIAPYDYVRGVGYGSSYIAELLVDFGAIGIFVGSAVYGILLTRATRTLAGGFLATFATLMLLKGALFVPRGSYVQPLVDPLSIPSLVALPLLAATVYVVRAASPSDRQHLRQTRRRRAAHP